MKHLYIKIEFLLIILKEFIEFYLVRHLIKVVVKYHLLKLKLFYLKFSLKKQYLVLFLLIFLVKFSK